MVLPPSLFWHGSGPLEEDELLVGGKVAFQLGKERDARPKAIEVRIIERADEARDRNPIAKDPEPVAEQQDATGATYVIERRRCG